MKLKDVIMIAIVSILFGIFYLAMVYFGAFLTNVLTPFGLGILGYEPVYGVWFMAATFTTYVMRKPYVGLIAEMLSALIEVLMGNMFGPIIFISGFIQGLGAEIPFALTKYKKYGLSTTILSSIVACIFSLFWTGFRQGYHNFDIKILIMIISIRLISSIFFCGILTKILADKLAKAGVLKGYAIAENFEE